MTPSLIDRRGIVTDDDRIQIENDAKFITTIQPPLVTQQTPSSNFVGNTIVLDPFNRPYNTEVKRSFN